MANLFQNFVSSLKPKQAPKFNVPNPFVAKTPVAPKPVPVAGNSQNSGALQANIGPMSTPVANTAATAPKPVAIAPAQKQAPLSTAGQNYASSLLGSSSAAPVQKTMPLDTVSEMPKAPSQKDNYISAYKKYIDSLNESSSIKEAKQAYNDYVANQSKSVAGLEGRDAGVPLTLVRGQQEKLLRQTQPEAQRLQNAIGIEQDSQKATIDSLKAGLDFEGKLLEQDKPVEVGGVLYQPQADGSYKAITSKEAEGFTLGKDQVRYDAQGNVVAGNSSSNTIISGADPIADSWLKYVQGGGKITDVPDEYQNAVAQGMATTEKPQSELSKNVVTVIDELLANTALDKISGPVDQYIGGLLGPQAILAKNKFDQLKGLLSLDNIKYLKGTGAISDAEQKLLANAASAIGRNLYGKQLATELNKLKAGLASVKDTQIAPDEEAFLKEQGYTDAEIQSLKGNVGKTSASIPASSRLASVNNNPGNLRFAGQSGAVQGEGGFAKFPTVEAGVKALENQIKLDASRGLTLSQFINKYAPPTENNTTKYVQDVVKLTGTTPNTPISSIDIKKLTQAIAQKESGTKIYG